MTVKVTHESQVEQGPKLLYSAEGEYLIVRQGSKSWVIYFDGGVSAAHYLSPIGSDGERPVKSIHVVTE